MARHRWQLLHKEKLKRLNQAAQNAAPRGEMHLYDPTAETRKPRIWNAARRASGAKVTTRPQLHTSATSHSFPDALTCSIKTICVTVEVSGLAQAMLTAADSHFTALHQLYEVSEEDVSVPFAKPLRIIGHLQENNTITDQQMPRPEAAISK